MLLMPDGFTIAPRWIPPTKPASLTATECLKASDSAEHVSVLLTRCHVVFSPGTRGVRSGGRGDELRLRGVVIRSPGTHQTLATGGGRLSSVPRHRSRVVWHSPDAGNLFSIIPPPHQIENRSFEIVAYFWSMGTAQNSQAPAASWQRPVL